MSGGFVPFFSYKELAQTLPLTDDDRLFIETSRKAIAEHLFSDSKKFVLIIGPCSVHNTEAMLSYASWLKNLQNSYSNKIFFIVRAYVEKSRTAIGWRGLARQPDPQQAENTFHGIQKARELLLAITKLRIPCAVEIVHPMLWYYWHDLISWGSIGARNIESQSIREMASAFPFPCGFKNARNGDIDAAIHAMRVAREPGYTVMLNEYGQLGELQTCGNSLIHLILRGTYNHPNWNKTPGITKILHSLGLPETIVIDTSHGNSRKNPLAQFSAMKSALKLRAKGYPVRGIMVESYIKHGNQLLSKTEVPDPECSITDPCLDLDSSQRLIDTLYRSL
ncbi:MAG TPA: 3-deoxy-7-phosphoheptulonate synthase [Spirochaetia bacterium]|nr:3-deoxy-7-phosphoheptulonate synthase [Spirochaetales bacterium]HRS65428.1 3-deoxy-7-phosphoheptulonate synthase [Spirochaetia bacterium]HOT58788.1 3-deoxy-7-phosphoheptulonate synthase [Spirochaetales bacterium]HPD80637.1 3-deoxy-7-phosphoheptulonate synthase [Spirochaetales bacterium]HQK34439.1 3-deoxy-7-phosphoheptulonate synthase [Spirochaetales bacterium]